MPVLSSQEVAVHLRELPDWRVESGELIRTYHFEDFRGSLGFVNRVGVAAEAAGHHPDIDIRYNRVTLRLITHDAGGLTVKDFNLADVADKLASPEGPV